MDRVPFSKNVLFQREFLAVFTVVVNAISWYFPLYALLTSIVNSFQIDYGVLLAVFGFHYAAVIGSALIGIIIVDKLVSRDNLLSLWMLIGVVASVSMSALGGNLAYLFLVSLVIGISLGLGFPSCLEYFADYGVVEQRGRIGGLIYCAAGLGILLMGLLTVIFPLTTSIIAFAMWRGIGLVAFVVIKPKQETTEEKPDASYKNILRERSFALYLVPWLMFSLINYLEGPILRNLFGTDFYYLQQIMEFGIGSIIALIGGVFSDMIGRKRVVIFGYILLGIGYAILGIFPESVISWYFYIVVDGVAWGIFALTFFLIIWGELAENRIKNKYYFLGTLPFIVSSYLETITSPYVGSITASATFSLASFFLFLAVLPLMYAPETLPEKKMEIRRLKSYVEQAKKLTQKRATKNNQKGN